MKVLISAKLTITSSVAGSHTTSGTLTLLFAHILRNPTVLEKVTAEIDTQLASIMDEIMPVEDLEHLLPYTMACFAESFRINPVFTMPLERKVVAKEGFEIEGHIISTGVRAHHSWCILASFH